MRLKGKIAIVTGGNSGIGRGIARRAVEEGAKVAIIGRDAAKGRDTLEELHRFDPESAFFRADLGIEAEAKDAVDAAIARFGRLDILVNNAGAGARRSGVQEADPPTTRLDKLLRPNLFAAYHVATHAMPALAKSGRGAIVNISSTATFHGNWGNYGIAKAAVEALTRSLAVEGAPAGIRVNSVSPGWIRTGATSPDGKVEEWEKTASLLGRMGTPDEIARAVVFLASDEASFITGSTLIVDGGLMVTDYPSLPFLDAVGAWRLFAAAVESG